MNYIIHEKLLLHEKKLSFEILIVVVSYQIINGDLDLYWQVLLLSKNSVLYDNVIHYS